jgi:hypothetical protein
LITESDNAEIKQTIKLMLKKFYLTTNSVKVRHNLCQVVNISHILPLTHLQTIKIPNTRQKSQSTSKPSLQLRGFKKTADHPFTVPGGHFYNQVASCRKIAHAAATGADRCAVTHLGR